MSRRKQEPEKYCVMCGNRLERKRYNGILEGYKAFLSRKYCSRSCANTRKEVTEAGMRWRAEQLRKSACEICGTTSNLHAHHIDGDITHNTPENIQTLCNSCHLKHHHYCRRNGMNIPGRMYASELKNSARTGWSELDA